MHALFLFGHKCASVLDKTRNLRYNEPVSEAAVPTLAAERRAVIVDLVAREGAVRAADLAVRFKVNTATIRRDLQVLESLGEVRRVHGGAVAVEEAGAENSAPVASQAQEARIGQAAAEMVAAGETLFLGSGRLSVEVARRLAAHSQLTIVTNGLEVAHWVATHTRHALIVTGGQSEGRGLGLEGPITRAALSDLRADTVIMELGGVSAVDGLTDDSLSRAEIARLLLGIGSRVVVLVAPERVGRAAAAYVAPVSEADAVVTTREAPSAFLWDLSEAGVQIVLA